MPTHVIISTQSVAYFVVCITSIRQIHSTGGINYIVNIESRLQLASDLMDVYYKKYGLVTAQLETNQSWMIM